MNTNMNELNLNEMELVNGGSDPADTAAAAATGSLFCGVSAGAIGAGLGLAAGPVGWLILGGVAVGGAAFATIQKLTSK